MPGVYANGDNTFHNIIDNESECHGMLRLDGIESVIAASWCQTILKTTQGQLIVRGEPLKLPNDASTVQCWLGQDASVAYLDIQGHVCTFDERKSTCTYSCVAMDGQGRIIAARQDGTLYLFASLDETLHSQAEENGTLLESPGPLKNISQITAGAAHFLVMTHGPLARVFAYGDNRFGQLGVPPSTGTSTSQLQHVDFFDGLEPVFIRAGQGSLHSAVITADGSLYIFGDDAKGQCGGFGGSVPTNPFEEVDGDLVVHDVGLGSAHTVAITSAGIFYAGERNNAESSLAREAARGAVFERVDSRPVLLWPSSAIRVLCSRWNTFLECPS